VGALNDAHGTNLDLTFPKTLGREVLEMEWAFNRAVGFTEADDELPAFFYDEPLPPSEKSARHHSGAVNESLRELLAQ
ncbi:MAG TPA: aldehyde ferredoxin oxidoreductase C-terminal domain-containing protein, partial [Burkholderiaceae bacterium]|nr:aldehyde ferredoxin oxidoreductase C-terminal domain-containing protein [Burkholderiaceae bacterium]